MPEQVPSQIGRYRIVGVVGQWTMGWIYVARDEMLGRDAWIKTLCPVEPELGLAPPPPWSTPLPPSSMQEARARFAREAQIAARLQHPNIINIHDYSEHQGMPFIGFEALKGRSLLEAMRTGISLKSGLPVILEVLDGLVYMHNKGIIHRDIRPASIFICTDGGAKVIDLFFAKVIGPAKPLAIAGSIIGTPSYMSPEQAMALTLDGRSDLFSVGSVLYEMVTGKKPFRGDSPVAVLFKVINEPQDMGPIPDGPEWKRLRGVITRALQKKTEDRYPDALAMRADLELALKELGESAEWTPPSLREAAGTRLH